MSTPRPTSSSGVKAATIPGLGIDGSDRSLRRTSIITATPALSSAPRRVLPSEVTIVVPTYLIMSRDLAGSTVTPPSSTIVEPSHPWWRMGSTPAPGSSGEVSTWAISPITGPLPVPGSLEYSTPPADSSTSSMPISTSSDSSIRRRSSWFGVDGEDVESSLGVVSTFTYLRKSSRSRDIGFLLFQCVLF